MCLQGCQSAFSKTWEYVGIAIMPSSIYQPLRKEKSFLEILRGSTISKVEFVLVEITGKHAKKCSLGSPFSSTLGNETRNNVLQQKNICWIKSPHTSCQSRWHASFRFDQVCSVWCSTHVLFICWSWWGCLVDPEKQRQASYTSATFLCPQSFMNPMVKFRDIANSFFIWFVRIEPLHRGMIIHTFGSFAIVDPIIICFWHTFEC